MREHADVTFGEFAGLYVENDRVCVIDGGPETWFGRYKKEVVASSYRRRHDSVQHLRELIPLAFPRITAGALDQFYVKVGYDYPRTAGIVAQTVKMVLRAAKVRGQRVSQEAIDVKAPRYTTGGKVFLTHEEVETLADTADPRLANVIRFAALAALAALTGLRQHEVFNLKDIDVMLGERAVIVRKSKTEAGSRTVPLIEAAREIVRDQRARRKDVPSEYIFPAPMGGRWNKIEFNKRLRKVREALPVSHPLRWVDEGDNEHNPFHALRHTFASLMIAAGVQPKVLQTLMGHRSIQTTMDTYGHLFPRADEVAMLLFEQHLAAGAAPQVPPASGETPLDSSLGAAGAGAPAGLQNQ